MSGEGAPPMTIGHERGVSGRPDLPTAAAWSTPRTAADERARIVAYLDAMADDALRASEATLDRTYMAHESLYRSAARAIEGGAHWHA